MSHLILDFDDRLSPEILLTDFLHRFLQDFFREIEIEVVFLIVTFG